MGNENKTGRSQGDRQILTAPDKCFVPQVVNWSVLQDDLSREIAHLDSPLVVVNGSWLNNNTNGMVLNIIYWDQVSQIHGLLSS